MKTVSDFRRAIVVSVALLCLSYPLTLKAQKGDCVRTANMRVYSSAYVQKDTGDLLGYDLALSSTRAATMNVLLFVHEGSPGEALPLSGRLQNGSLVIEGEWFEHQIEYPAKKEIVLTHSVKITGTVDEHLLSGEIAIADITTPQKIRLKRVAKIWMCKN